MKYTIILPDYPLRGVVFDVFSLITMHTPIGQIFIITDLCFLIISIVFAVKFDNAVKMIYNIIIYIEKGNVAMYKLLELLNENADFTPAQLAAMLGESELAVKEQIEDYKSRGIIKGTRTLIDWEKLPDSGVRAIIELKVTPKAETGFDDIAKIVMSYDNVENVYLAASSRYDLIAMVKGNTIQEIAEFVSKRLSTLDAVIGTATNFVLNTYKQGGVVFHDESEDDEQRSMIV